MSASLSRLGEFGLIREIARLFNQGVPPEVQGIGDDCAVIPLNSKQSLLVTTDLLIENRHFLLNRIPAHELGWKSLAVSISDIAAMGGIPSGAFLSISIPSTLSLKWIRDFYKGIKKCCDTYHVYLLGGDTTKSPGPLVINFTVTGKAATDKIKYRSDARPGDLICVTGWLGDSGGGLRILLENKPQRQLEKKLIKRHHVPLPQVEEGLFLAGFKDVSAMMDVSDGIDSDIRRIMEASGTGAVITTDNLPISGELKTVCQRYAWDSTTIALTGGEDYCLLLTLKPGSYEAIAGKFRKRFNKNLSVIGKIVPSRNGLSYKKEGKTIQLRARGFDHFMTS